MVEARKSTITYGTMCQVSPWWVQASVGRVQGYYAGPVGHRRWLGGVGLPQTVGMDEHSQGEAGKGALRSINRSDGGGADGGDGGGLFREAMRRKSGVRGAWGRKC